MTREWVAKKIHWTKIIWTVSIVNPLNDPSSALANLANSPNSRTLIGFSFNTFFVQAGFSSHGFFTNDRFIRGSNGLAAAMTFLTILSTLYFRNIAG